MTNRADAKQASFYRLIELMAERKIESITLCFKSPGESWNQIYLRFTGISNSFHARLPSDRVHEILMRSHLVSPEHINTILHPRVCDMLSKNSVVIDAKGHRLQ